MPADHDGATVAPKSIRAALETSATASAVTFAIAGAVVAGVASSRAAHHTLSAAALVGLVAAWGATLSCVGWFTAVYAGAADVIDGKITFSGEPLPGPTWAPDKAAVAALRRAVDGFAPAAMWRSALLAAAVAAVWSGAGGGLVAAVLNGRQARWIVVAAALAGLSGFAAAVVDTVGRRRGMAAAQAAMDAPTPAPQPLRYRAWRQVAVPIALVQAAVNGAATWVLFHSYTRATLTSKVAVADLIVMVVLLGVLFTTLGGTMGRVDVRLGRVEAPADPARRKVGAQAVGYAGFLVLLLGKLAQTVLPKAPNLLQVGAARAALAFAMAACATAFGYVRGAVNAGADL